MRRPSNFEYVYKGSTENQEKEQEFAPFFPITASRTRRQGNNVRHIETRLFRNKKGETTAEGTKSPSFIERKAHNSCVGGLSFIKGTPSIYQNSNDVSAMQNSNRSDYSTDGRFHFRPNDCGPLERSDKVETLTTSSTAGKNHSTLSSGNRINYSGMADARDSVARNKGVVSQCDKEQGCFSSLPSAVEVGAGLSSSQRERFQKCMETSPLNHNQVKLKILELLQYWMGLPSVRLQILSLVQDVLLQAGINASPVREAWCETSRTSSCKGRFTANVWMHTSGSSVDGPGSCVDSHVTALDVNVLPSSSFSARKDSDSNTSTGLDHSSYHPSPSSSPPPAEMAEAPLRDVNRKPENIGRQVAEFLPSPSPTTAETTPRRANNATTSPYSSPSTCPSPLVTKELNHNELTLAYNKIVDVSCASKKQTEKAENKCIINYNRWSSFSREVDGCAPTTSGDESSNQGPLGASYEVIPQFYFPLGRPTTREGVISGPLSTKIQNPHLKFLECVPLESAMYDTTEPACNSLASPANSDKASLHRDLATLSMSTLRSIEDKDVRECLLKGFSKIPHSHKLSSKNHSVEGQFSGSRRPSHLNKRETSCKHYLIECIERICVNCFGIPRYFAFIILCLFQNDLAATSSDAPSPNSGNRSGFSSSTHGPATSPRMKHINALYLCEFYEYYLKGKDSIRRTFDLLILSSTLKNDGTMLDNQKFRHQEPFSQGTTALRSFLLPGDFVEYINVLLQHHPGLSFLKKNPEFQPKYMSTVIYRIFYEVDRHDRGFISFADFSSSRLMDAFRLVDTTLDINSVLLFFSYEHFYVLYCRFWELDEDSDMMLSKKDFSRYFADDACNPVIVQRIFSGVGRRIRCEVEGYIGYEDFVWFCLSEEDKSTPQAIRYWFRILDLDGDGILSIYEIQTFYNMVEKNVSFAGECVACFEDVIRQAFDMIRCPEYRGLTLADLLHDPEAAHVLLNMLTNSSKLLQYEQSDPLVAHQERLIGGPEQCYWDRFARAEYDRMAQETDT